MAWVRMLHYISGGRADGSQWPGPGGLLECSEAEARDLIRGQNAVRAEAPAQPFREEPVKSVTVAPPPEPAPEPVPPEPEPVPQDEEPPAPADPKAAWVDYAVSQGADPDEAARMTKADLQSKYGGRMLRWP